jgi:hypothetical protein
VRSFTALFACAILLTSVPGRTQTTPVPVDTPAGKEGILSDTQGVDFTFYLGQVVHITQSSWKPLMPREVEAPVRKTGTVRIRYKILPNGHVMEGGMVLEGRSGDEALDRAAWGAIATSIYPPMPVEFKGPYLELRFIFIYNQEQQRSPVRKLPKPLTIPGPGGVTLGYKSKL